MKQYHFLILMAFLFFQCEKESVDVGDFTGLKDLPVDEGGIHEAFIHESTTSPYGYYFYTPGGYQSGNYSYPLLVFLHGSGEKGNSSTDPDKLDLVLRNGPPKMIENDTWSPVYPMLVASPQCHDGYWSSKKVHEFIKYLINSYKVNPKRIYVTGLSMGGIGTFNYAGDYGDSCYAAATIPICGKCSLSKAVNFTNIPVWAFHGDDDRTITYDFSENMINAINAADPGPVHKAKLTVYAGVGHNSWSRTYDGTGIGTGRADWDPFDEDVYSWMLGYTKD